ncbi:CbtA family protein, partial [Variovorax sp. 2RAF20]
MIFQRLIWSALAAAVLVGSVQTGVQQWRATPIIQAAESYESQKAAPAGHGHDAAHAHGAAADEVQWQPEDGAERSFWS